MTLSNQDIERVANCTFQPRNGRYFDRCRERATWVDDAKTTYRSKRCDRHLAIDKRTSQNRQRWHGYGFMPEYVPFDATAALAALTIERAEQAENARLVQNHETLVKALQTAVNTKALSDVDQPIVERLLKAYRGE